MNKADVVIIGSGAAGMMCAIQAGMRGRSVILLDHAKKLAEKIRISGGGNCNFTNIHAKPENYISENPHFCRSALARYTPQDFIALLKKHNIGFHEKKLGQLFCSTGADAIIGMLKNESDAHHVKRHMGTTVESITRQSSGHFHLETSRGSFAATSLVIATGGLSIPKTGATPFGYRVAEQFGIPVTKLKAGLVPLTFAPEQWKPYADLTGVSFPAVVTAGKQSFREDLLVTHRGLSGPAILQASSYWQPGCALHIDLLPDLDMRALLLENSRKQLSNFLAQWLPKSFADVWCSHYFENKPLNQYSEKQKEAIASHLHDWQVTPSGTMGYAKAEVTCGGVDTHALSSKTMECKDVPGLYFIGEVVDVTGWLGGYNFQWAWASGFAAGQVV